MGTGAQPHAFGELLRRYRGEKGFSQEELAAQAGLSVQAVSALERGVTQWPPRCRCWRRRWG
jgi:transcriptional regulator with XRE-family HTH domain